MIVTTGTKQLGTEQESEREMMEYTVKTRAGAIEKFDSIQACRFLAAAMVLWAHFQFVIGPETSNAWWVKTGMGGFGVDLFFVISGFVMVICTRGRNLSKCQFLKARFIRIMPLYLICSLPFFAKDIWNGQWARLFNSIAFFPVFDVTSHSGISHPLGWTIAFEIWFYILFSVVLLNKISSERIKICILVGTMALTAGFFYTGNWFLPLFLFSPLVLEFLSGCIIAELYPKVGKKSAICIFVTSIVLYFNVVPRYDELLSCETVMASFKLSLLKCCVWGVPAALFCLSVVALENLRILRTPKILVSLGGASFSLYLAQPYFMHFSRAIFSVAQSVWLTAVAYFALSIGISLFISWYFEKPLLRMSRAFFSKKPEFAKSSTKNLAEPETLP